MAIWLAIDPGVAIVGWAVFTEKPSGEPRLIEYGAILTSKKLSLPKRLSEVANDFEQLILTHTPDKFAIEQPFFPKKITTAGMIHGAVGVMLSVWGKHKEEDAIMLHQSSWKAWWGSGSYKKKDVIELVCTRYGLGKNLLDDTADAIAIGTAAIAGLRNNIK